MYAKQCKICQQFKKRKTLYGNIPTKNKVEQKLWDLVHVDLIGKYINCIIQQNLGGSTIKIDDSIIYMITIDPTMGWF